MNHNDNRINAYKKIADFSTKQFTSDEVEKNNAAVAALKKAEIEEAKEELEKKFQKKFFNRQVLDENIQKNSFGIEETQNSFIPLKLEKMPAFYSHTYRAELEKKESSQKIQQTDNFQKKIPSPQKNTNAVVSEKHSKNAVKQFIPQDLNQNTVNTQTDFIPLSKPIVKDEQTNAFIKTTLNAEQIRSGKKESTYRRVAKFLLLIGNDEAAKILPHLPQNQIDKIISEIASIQKVEPVEALEILTEFEVLVQKARESGGLSTARTILEKAFGNDKAEKVILKAMPFPDGKPFEYLHKMDDEHLFLLLKDEPSTIRSLVLSHLPPENSAHFIKRLPKDEQKDVIHRLAKLKKLDPDTVRRVNESIAKKAEKIETVQINAIDGKSALAEILRKMPAGTESAVLSQLNHLDPALEQDLRSRLFTLDDVVLVNDDFIQGRLQMMSETEIAVLIADKKPEFRQKILANVSKGRGSLILEEESLKKPLSKKEVHEVTNQFFSILRRAWEKGELQISGRNEEEWVQ